MDITSVAFTDVVHFYSRQEKYAEARKNAQSRLIKTAVAERVTLSRDARLLADSLPPEAAAQARQVTQALPGERRSYSAAREYRKNQVPEKPAEGLREVETRFRMARRPAEARGAQPPPGTGAAPSSSVLISGQIPQYALPIPRELKIYLSNLPKEKRSPIKNEGRRKAA